MKFAKAQGPGWKEQVSNLLEQQQGSQWLPQASLGVHVLTCVTAACEHPGKS